MHGGILFKDVTTQEMFYINITEAEAFEYAKGG